MTHPWAHSSREKNWGWRAGSGPVPCAFHGPWVRCVVCRKDAASALALLSALQPVWPEWPGLATPVFGRPLRLAKLVFLRVVLKTELFLGLSKLSKRGLIY